MDLMHGMCSYGHFNIKTHRSYVLMKQQKHVLYLFILNYVEFMLSCIARMGPCWCMWTYLGPMNGPHEARPPTQPPARSSGPWTTWHPRAMGPMESMELMGPHMGPNGPIRPLGKHWVKYVFFDPVLSGYGNWYMLMSQGHFLKLASTKRHL